MVCLNVLDHVQSPTAVLQEIRRILRDDGELFLSLDLEGQDEYCHPHGFNLQQITHLLTVTGFRPIKAQTSSTVTDTGRSTHFSSVCKLVPPAEGAGEGLSDPDQANGKDVENLAASLHQAEIVRAETEIELGALRDLVQRYEQGRFVRFMAAVSRLRGRLRAAINRIRING